MDLHYKSADGNAQVLVSVRDGSKTEIIGANYAGQDLALQEMDDEEPDE